MSKIFALKSGIGVERLVGYYWNVERPAGAADQALKWSINTLF